MAARYWIAKWSMGYAGTDSEEEIDLVEYFGYTEDEVKAMTDEEAAQTVAQEAYEQAVQRVDSWAEVDTDQEG